MKGNFGTMSLQAKLTACILVASLCLIGVSAFMLYDALEENAKADRLGAINQCSEQFFLTVEHLAFERGRSNVVLSTATPISEANRVFIAQRRKRGDGHLMTGLDRLQRIDAAMADTLRRDYAHILDLRERMDAAFQLTAPSRNPNIRDEWVRHSTAFMFQIKMVIENLGKKELAEGLFDFHQQFQLQCIEFRLLSGQSASILSAALLRGTPLTPEEYLEFIELRAKADYLWSNIESDVDSFKSAEMLDRKSQVYEAYYKEYRPLQTSLLARAMQEKAPKELVEDLISRSVPAFDSIFKLINTANTQTRTYVQEMQQKANRIMKLAVLQFFLVLGFVAFTVGYFRSMLFQPLERIVTALKGILTGQTTLVLEAEAKRQDEIGLLTHGVQLLQGSLQEERRLKNFNESLAMTDKLTGLHNRQMLDQKIESLMEYADRYDEKLSMAIFDLDHFKTVNDTWGHPIGDEVLKQTAQTAGRLIRDPDLLFRLGGEEFLLLMPHTDGNGASAAAEKIRAAIEESRHPVAGQTTASFGVAERNRAESFRNWYNRVDEALYRAKNSGRNRSVCSTADTMPFTSLHMNWQPEWESGNPVIDGQHKVILDIAGELMEAVLLPRVDAEKARLQLDRLFKHITYHFDCEEQILDDVGYPRVGEHRAIHQKLLAKASNLTADYLSGEIKASAFFSFILDDVLMGHMLKEDSLFFPFVRPK